MKKNYIKIFIILVVLIGVLFFLNSKGYLSFTDKTPILMTINAEGGKCTYGVCSSTTVIQESGRYNFQSKLEQKRGKISAEQATKLKNMINNTDFVVLKSKPFVGTCPTAYDGQKYIYIFQTNNGVSEVDSCETQIEGASSLFIEIGSIMNTINLK